MKLKASVLPLVIVLGVLILTTVWMLVGLMDLNLTLFAHKNRLRMERANVESAFRLYCNYPQTEGQMELFAQDTLSRVTICKRSWGLYDLVSIGSCTGRASSTRLVGVSRVMEQGSAFWYCNNRSTLTVAGNTNLKGRLFLPVNGVVYTSAAGLVFSGEEIRIADITYSGAEIPPPEPVCINRVDSLFEIHKYTVDNNRIKQRMENRFNNTQGLMVRSNSEILRNHTLRGYIVLLADEITIDRSCTISNIVIVARKATIGKNFRGSMQLFATDTIIADSGSQLYYPSGLYARKYIQIKEKADVQGYVVVHGNQTNQYALSYRQARSARVRGLLYVDGLAQLQGVVSGSAILRRARHYTDQGYYNDMICDATVIGDMSISYPMWLAGFGKRKEACRVE